jgi:hypothetical protein
MDNMNAQSSLELVVAATRFLSFPPCEHRWLLYSSQPLNAASESSFLVAWEVSIPLIS